MSQDDAISGHSEEGGLCWPASWWGNNYSSLHLSKNSRNKGNHSELGITRLEIRGCREPLNSTGAPLNFCRDPKDVLVCIHNTCS